MSQVEGELAQLQASPGYWGEVWARFLRSGSARAGAVCICAIFTLAFLAPFLADKRPYFWCERDTGGAIHISFPVLREFFAPSEAPERLLECSFNYSFAFIVLGGAAWILTQRPRFRPSRNVALSAAAVLALLPFLYFNVWEKPYKDTKDYRVLAEQKAGWGIFPPLVYGPFESGFGMRNAPCWSSTTQTVDAAATGHWLGTDNAGRDVLSRMIHGARVSLSVGIIATALSTIIGVFFGALAGYFGGWVDNLISRFIEILICVPTFFLILTIIAVMDKRSILNIMLVIGCTGWTGVARLVRGEVLRQRQLDYVASAVALGASSLRVIFRHILPNALAPVLVSVTFGIAGSILTESGLSFLGFGVDVPSASWGEMLNQAREAPTVYWWLAVFPGLSIFATVTIANLVGEELRDAMDPRLRSMR